MRDVFCFLFDLLFCPVTPLARLVVGCLACAALGYLLAGAAALAQMSEQEAVEMGREALTDNRRYPWYDRQTDSLRPLNVQAARQATSPNDWEWRDPEINLRPANTNKNWGLYFWEFVKALAWTLLLALFVGGAVLLARFYVQRTESDVDDEAVEVRDEVSRHAERIEALPFTAPAPQGSFRDTAQKMQAAGDYSQGIVYLYSHLLMLLDEHGVIRLTRGKTNRQYLRETRVAPAAAPPFERVMLAFEDVFFGNQEIGAERFSRCFAAVEEVERQVEAQAV